METESECLSVGVCDYCVLGLPTLRSSHGGRGGGGRWGKRVRPQVTGLRSSAPSEGRGAVRSAQHPTATERLRLLPRCQTETHTSSARQRPELVALSDGPQSSFDRGSTFRHPHSGLRCVPSSALTTLHSRGSGTDLVIYTRLAIACGRPVHLQPSAETPLQHRHNIHRGLKFCTHHSLAGVPRVQQMEKAVSGFRRLHALTG